MSTTTKRLHLVGAKTRRQFTLHSAALEQAAKGGKPPPPARAFDWDGFSGRGVELRQLAAVEKDAAMGIAAREVGEHAKMHDLRARQL
jgi:hypothetical protein